VIIKKVRAMIEEKKNELERKMIGPEERKKG
jgi:hypothetical protein